MSRPSGRRPGAARAIAILLVAAVGLAATGLVRAEEGDRKSIEEAAAKILDAKLPAPERDALIASRRDRAGELIAALSHGLGADSAEEYRRIPRIWQVAIAAGKENKEETLREVLRVSLPQPGAALADWQAVVIGGGVINGIGLIGEWPRARIEQVLESDAALKARWERSLKAAVVMADNPGVKNGTRYDALRMVAMLGWDPSREQLFRYLGKSANGELQMGAVSGLVDIPDPAATDSLLKHFPGLAPGNQNMALEGLLRSDERMLALLAAIERGDVTIAQLGEERAKRLLAAESAKVKERASVILKPAS